MKYLQPSFTHALGGSDNYEETFVVCHNDDHSQTCCVPCASCGVRVRIGLEKRHECFGLKELGEAMAQDALLTVNEEGSARIRGLTEYAAYYDPEIG